MKRHSMDREEFLCQRIERTGGQGIDRVSGSRVEAGARKQADRVLLIERMRILGRSLAVPVPKAHRCLRTGTS